MNNMTLAKWLTDNNFSYVEEAEMYEIGQELTEDEAWHVRRILTRSYIDTKVMSIEADRRNFWACSYEEFMYMIIDLMDAENYAWYRELPVTFDEVDHEFWYWIDKERRYQEEADEMEALYTTKGEIDTQEREDYDSNCGEEND